MIKPYGKETSIYINVVIKPYEYNINVVIKPSIYINVVIKP